MMAFAVLTYPSICSVKPKSTWGLLKPHFENLVSSYVFPQLSFNATKQEQWTTDPIEFVRTTVGELCVTHIRYSTNLLTACARRV